MPPLRVRRPPIDRFGAIGGAAALVAIILSNDALRVEWMLELAEMRQTMLTIRSDLADALRQQWTAAGQGHCLQYADELDAAAQKQLLDQLATIDPAKASAMYKRAKNPPPDKAGPPAPLDTNQIERLATAPRAKRDGWRKAGLDACRRGEVAILLLAGGQGTRLGFDKPKGMFDVRLPSRKSLFRLQGERLLALERLAKAPPGSIPWYVMTSAATDQETRNYFRKERCFGLRPSQVFFFEQGVAPAFLDDGSIALETKSRVAVAPNGNGGVYDALRDSGALQDMRSRSIKHVYQYCVDNALVKVGDPEFIGFCSSEGADCASKVVPKGHAHEKVGVLAQCDGRVRVVEYSEISRETAEKIDLYTGRLLFGSSHICVNYFSVAFLAKCIELVDKLPLHVAHKKIPNVHDSAPSAPNGIKLELFIFDTFPFAAKFRVLEGTRGDDFAPVKNATGKDSPESARELLLKRDRRWLAAAGASISPGPVEVASALSYDGEGLEAFAGATVAPGLISAAPAAFSPACLVAVVAVLGALVLTS